MKLCLAWMASPPCRFLLNLSPAGLHTHYFLSVLQRGLLFSATGPLHSVFHFLIQSSLFLLTLPEAFTNLIKFSLILSLHSQRHTAFCHSTYTELMWPSPVWSSDFCLLPKPDHKHLESRDLGHCLHISSSWHNTWHEVMLNKSLKVESMRKIIWTFMSKGADQ